jgi:hypothetical protein
VIGLLIAGFLLATATLTLVVLLRDDLIEPQELEEARDVTGRSKDSCNVVRIQHPSIRAEES